MTHIVIDARESGTSTGRYIDKLVEHLHALQPQYRITLLAKQKRVAHLQKLAPDFNVVVTPYKEFTFGEQLGFRRQIAGLQPDLVHFGIVQQPLLYRGRVVTTMHDLTTLRFRNPAKNTAVFWTKQQVYKLVNVIAAHKSARILVPSKFVRDDVAAYCRVPLSKIMVTYEAADPLPPGSAPYEPVHNAPFIMYIGRPTPHKNLGRLIDAFVVLQQTHPDLRLVLAGKKDANYERYERIVAERSIKNVVFTDFVTDEQYRWLLEHCRAYVFPSLSEGFGLPGLEAMRHGAPVVSSNATCLPEILGDAAHYFDPLDVAAMAGAIAEVIDNEPLRASLAQKGTSRAALYSWQRLAEQTLEIYGQALQD